MSGIQVDHFNKKENEQHISDLIQLIKHSDKENNAMQQVMQSRTAKLIFHSFFNESSTQTNSENEQEIF
jgi:hypothetical protein